MSRPVERLHDVSAAFERLFSAVPQLEVRAPGRVNLIGEHTDYNDGFVLPLAIDREVRIALAPRDDGRVVLHSVDFDRRLEFEAAAPQKEGGWGEYAKGVAWSLTGEGFELQGFQGCMSGNVPRGAGLSSSAAVELAVARAFAAVSGFDWEPERIALACQRAENEWLGVASGVMDQLASACGQRDHALLIDCRSLAIDPVPLPPGSAVLILDTGTRRGLVGSAYNERRQQCDDAAELLGARKLRDVTPAGFAGRENDLPEPLRRRARHVISENERTLEAARALTSGDGRTVGKLMNASHASLRDDFEVSSPALDAIVACAQRQEGCYGARLTGAGFGGCAVALADAEAAETIAAAVADCYRQAVGKEATIYTCRAADGARLTVGN